MNTTTNFWIPKTKAELTTWMIRYRPGTNWAKYPYEKLIKIYYATRCGMDSKGRGNEKRI